MWAGTDRIKWLLRGFFEACYAWVSDSEPLTQFFTYENIDLMGVQPRVLLAEEKSSFIKYY